MAWLIKKNAENIIELTRPSLVHTATGVLLSEDGSFCGYQPELLCSSILYRQSGNVQQGLSFRVQFSSFVSIELATKLAGRHTAMHRWSSQYASYSDYKLLRVFTFL